MEIKKAPIWKWGVFVVVIVFLILTLIGIMGSFFSSPSKNGKEPKQKTSTIQQQSRASRILSATFTIPDSATVTAKNMYYIYGGSRKKRDRIIVEVLNGPYKNLLWLNKNLPSIQMKKPKTIIYACPPGIGKKNKIKFMNMGGESLSVQVRIIPYRT